MVQTQSLSGAPLSTLAAIGPAGETATAAQTDPNASQTNGKPKRRLLNMAAEVIGTPLQKALDAGAVEQSAAVAEQADQVIGHILAQIDACNNPALTPEERIAILVEAIADCDSFIGILQQAIKQTRAPFLQMLLLRMQQLKRALIDMLQNAKREKKGPRTRKDGEPNQPDTLE